MAYFRDEFELEYRQPEIVLGRFREALALFRSEIPPFDPKTGERALVFRLGLHLHTLFRPMIVDSEYDRNIRDNKRIRELFEIRFTDFENQQIGQILPKVPNSYPAPPSTRRSIKGDRIYPDLIVHHRRYNDNNVLVVEVKKSKGNPIAIHKDIQKLKGFTQPDYGYVLGIFLELSLIEPRWLAFTEGELNLDLSYWPRPVPKA
ncbi:hypothetical protein [Deinococcus sp. Leaf326]|uniref:hypothetical protein n=1 Tax=Deinococcus sp. Leaf326 TaxID=1736338 RepID=UPI0012E30BBB|nr:hypothetical protein [Deinococcus sp. Leaf326]